MKKLVASLMALSAAALLSAQVTFGIGARGQFGLALGSSVAGDTIDDDESVSVQPFKSFLAGGALVGRLGFDAVPGLFLQPEIGFSHNQVGFKLEYNHSKSYNLFGQPVKEETEYEEEDSFGYNSIDIPIIIGYDVEIGSGMVVSPFAGFNLSIPVGSINVSSGSATGTVTTTINGVSTEEKYDSGESSDSVGSVDAKVTVVPGVLLGVGFGYKFDDHNMLMGDLRYLLDFTPVQADLGAVLEWDILTRRGLTLGVNYVYFF